MDAPVVGVHIYPKMHLGHMQSVTSYSWTSLQKGIHSIHLYFVEWRNAIKFWISVNGDIYQKGPWWAGSCDGLEVTIHRVYSVCSHRQQCVHYDSTTSEWSAITCGVPQGTKVGSTVFLAMVNNVATDIPFRWKYVDDITVVEAVSNQTHAWPTTMQLTMDSINNQAAKDHMTLNPAKCAIMQVSFGRTLPPALHILADSREIGTVT